MDGEETEGLEREIKPISYIWHAVLTEHEIPMEGTIVEVAPGYETKIGDALAMMGFCGTLILVEPDKGAASHMQEAYERIMPGATVRAVVKPLQSVCIGEDIPLKADALVANHPLDDMAIAFAMHERYLDFFSQERKEGTRLSSCIKEIYDTISDKDYIRGILRTIAVWKEAVQKSKPSCVIISQYPSHKLAMKGLSKRQNSGSIIIELLKDFYERYMKDLYKEKSFETQGDPAWWMIARKPYAELTDDLRERPHATRRLGEEIFVRQRARRLDAQEADIVYADHAYFASSLYGADSRGDLSNFAIVLDDQNIPSSEAITVYADRQKDATQISLGGNLGSGRAVYYGNRYNVLGVGKTSLCTSSLPSHSTGRMDLVGALRRVVLSKWINYFAKRATAHPLVIARKQTAQFKWSPNPVPLALLVRIDEGTLDRPSHIECVPDITIDFERALTQYAQLDAEYFAYRFMLGAWSMGNYSLNGHIIDLETVSFARYRGPYTTASSKYRENVFGYESLGFVRILRQLADIKGIKDTDVEKRFYAKRRAFLARCFLTLLGIDESQFDLCFSGHRDRIIALSDQCEMLAKKISPAKTDLNLYRPIPDREDPALFDMTRLFRSLGDFYESGSRREGKAFNCSLRKRALAKVRPDVIYEPTLMPNGHVNQSELFVKEQAVVTHDRLEWFLDETKHFIRALFQLLDDLDSEGRLLQKSYWKERLKTVNQDFPPMHELNSKLMYWVEEYRLGRIDPETLGVEIEKLCELPHHPTGKDFHLDNVPLVNYLNLSRRELQSLFPRVHTADFRKGESITRAGLFADSFYILMQGSCTATSAGEEIGKIRGRGALIGEEFLIGDRTAIADVVAETPVRVLQIHRNDGRSAMSAHPELKRLLTNIIAQKKEGVSERIVHAPICKGIDPEQLRIFLADKASEKKFHKGERVIEQGVHTAGVYFLARGSVILSRSEMNSAAESLELGDTPLAQGIFGERSILFDEGAICTVIANEDVVTLFIDQDDFRELLDLQPRLLHNCISHIGDYSRSNRDRVSLASELQKKLHYIPEGN